jgi:hypothetical protein
LINRAVTPELLIKMQLMRHADSRKMEESVEVYHSSYFTAPIIQIKSNKNNSMGPMVFNTSLCANANAQRLHVTAENKNKITKLIDPQKIAMCFQRKKMQLYALTLNISDIRGHSECTNVAV